MFALISLSDWAVIFIISFINLVQSVRTAAFLDSTLRVLAVSYSTWSSRILRVSHVFSLLVILICNWYTFITRVILFDLNFPHSRFTLWVKSVDSIFTITSSSSMEVSQVVSFVKFSDFNSIFFFVSLVDSFLFFSSITSHAFLILMQLQLLNFMLKFHFQSNVKGLLSIFLLSCVILRLLIFLFFNFIR